MKKILTAVLLAMCTGCTRADSRYYAIDHFYFQEEGDAFREAFAEASIQLYDWYRSIEGNDGVYILHSEHYTDDLLDLWRDNQIYAPVPEKGYWYFAVSEHYLRERGFALSPQESEAIRSGVRLYLLPDTLSQDEQNTMEAHLRTVAVYGLNGSPMIETSFESDPKVSCRTYHFEGTFETEEDGEITNPVVYVCSSENMKYFESESLIATGKKDSYIKLTKEAYEKYVQNGFPEELKDRQITFLPLSQIRN